MVDSSGVATIVFWGIHFPRSREGSSPNIVVTLITTLKVETFRKRFNNTADPSSTTHWLQNKIQ